MLFDTMLLLHAVADAGMEGASEKSEQRGQATRPISSALTGALVS
jgi:hypothetical protein